MPKTYYVYMLCSKTRSTLYIGVTNDLRIRVAQHKEAKVEGFTKKYNVNQLVYFEEFADVRDAIAREKQMKKWRRAWKDELIDKFNATWRDLFDEL